MYHIPIFISHSWSYPGHYETLAEWLFGNQWNVNGIPIEFQDVSVPKSHPIHNAPNSAALKSAIFSRIIQAKVVVIPTGMYVNYSNWIAKEIEGAKYYGKPILAVNPWGQEKKSSDVVSASDANVGWNKQSVIKAVWNLSRNG